MSQTAHWSAIAERGSLLGMRILLWTYRIFGRHILLIVLLPVVLYFYLSGKQARQASQTFLARAQRINSQVPTGFIAGFRHFLSFARSAFDKIDAWLGRIRVEDIRYTNDALFKRLKEQPRGAIFIGSHLGNLEVCRALNASKYGTPINVLVFTGHAIKFNALLQKVNPDVQINMLQVSDISPGLMIQLRDKIDAGESLVIVGDRTSTTMAGRVSYANFLGHNAPFSQGPFILASLLECPVYLMFCLREGHHYRVIFEQFKDQLVLPRKNRTALLAQAIEDYADRLAHYAVQYPLQWFNFYDFWQQDNVVERHQNKDKN